MSNELDMLGFAERIARALEGDTERSDLIREQTTVQRDMLAAVRSMMADIMPELERQAGQIREIVAEGNAEFARLRGLIETPAVESEDG